MNRKYESPMGREPEATEPSQRLQEVERRLKQAHPRPPSLDLGELQQLALAASTDPAVERRAATLRRSGRGVYHRIAIVAGSWACGVVVGSLAMFLLTGGGGPGNEPAGPTAHHDPERSTPTSGLDVVPPAIDEVVQKERPSDPSPAKKSDPPGKTGARWAAFDRFGSGRGVDWPDGRPLRAGMHLGPWDGDPTEASQQVTRFADECRPEQESGRAGVPMRPRPDPAPYVAITREWLLEDLQREMPDLVL